MVFDINWGDMDRASVGFNTKQPSVILKCECHITLFILQARYELGMISAEQVWVLILNNQGWFERASAIHITLVLQWGSKVDMKSE